MGCDDKNQSAIEEARDQLFLDTADGGRLNNVTGNLGLDRPGVGFGDDEWRAVGKFVGINFKQIRNIFYRMIELCLGPQFARIGTLAAATEVADHQLLAIDPAPFIQLGTLIVDPTLPTEETVNYCIRDLTSGRFFLKTALQFAHAIIPPGSGLLSTTAPAGSTLLQLISAADLPDPGVVGPYPVILDRGTLEEEVMQVTAIDFVLNQLTLLNPTALQHDGPDTLFYTAVLAQAEPAGRTFLQFDANDTRGFGSAGWVRIDHGNASDEVVQFESNDVVESVLFLKMPLVNVHAANQHVELVRPGAGVEVCQLLEQGVHWSLWETAPRKVQVLIPKDFKKLGPFDATWMHDTVPAPVSTTASLNSAPGDFAIGLVSGVGFPTAGMVSLSAGTPVGFLYRALQTDVIATVKNNTLAGDLAAQYTLDAFSPQDMPTTVRPFWVVIDSGGGSQEFALVTSAVHATGQLIFSAPLVNPHTAGQTIGPVDQVLLDQPLVAPVGSGDTVALVRVPYGGFPLLEEGNNRDNTGAVQLDHFPGGYVFDNTLRGVSAISSFLSTLVPPIIEVAWPQLAARTNIEVMDADDWPASPFTPFKVRIGEGTGSQEDRTIIDRTLQGDATGTVLGPSIVGDTSMTYTLVSVGEFPESDGVYPAGYRVIIDRGGAHEEIAIIGDNAVATHTFTFMAALTQPHAATETLELLNDVLTFDLLTRAHPTIGELVHAYITELFVSPAPTDFPSAGGWLWLNFGKEILNVRKRITVITSPTSYQLASTVDLPTSNYPYRIVLSEGQFNEESVLVTNNDGVNTLTFAGPGAVNTHVVGEYAFFECGDPEVVEYRQKLASPDRLVFQVPTLLNSGHIVGERVMYSPLVSASNPDGSSYGFKLPPDPSACLKAMFELVRAAGIQVTITLK